MDAREAKLREIVAGCLPCTIQLRSLELGHGTLFPGQTPKTKIVVYAAEVPGPDPDPSWFVELHDRVRDLFGPEAFYLAILEDPAAVAV
jgi:hypothetical protein